MILYDIMTEIIFFTGITGINKSQFINNLIQKSGKSSEILLVDFEKELTDNNRPGISPSNIPDFLDIPNPYTKVKIIQDTFDWIKKKISKQTDIKYIFVNIHLSYYKNSEFFPPLNLQDFSSLVATIPKPHVKIITLIDDIFSIWQRIVKKEDVYFKTKLRLGEILAWRSLESIRSESLSTWLSYSKEGGVHSANNYLVSVRHPYDTFHNLIFQENPKTMYLSYPITYPRTDSSSMKEVNDYRKELHQMGQKLGVSIFDPVTIDELSLIFKLNSISETETLLTLEESDRWPLEIPEPLVEPTSWPIIIPVEEINEVKSSISDQVQARDYALVDAAGILSVYRPYYKGNRSDGVDAEIKHAKEVGNTVVVYSTKEDEDAANLQSGSPFASRTHYFYVKEDFINHLQLLITKDKAMDK